jgi:hypothetical protein
MCGFFKKYEKRAVQWFSFSMVFVPTVIGCFLYAREQEQDANICFYMAVWSIPSILSGYLMRDLKKCQLPHVPENIQEEQPGLSRNER